MKVFISYASQDADMADQLAQALEEEGLEVWDARKEILPGENWAAKTGQGLDESDAMVLLFTPNSLHSASVNSSGSFALGQEQYQDKLVPVTALGLRSDDEQIPWVYKMLNPVELTPENSGKEAFREIAERLKGAEPAQPMPADAAH